MSLSQIQRMNGAINKINDQVIGGRAAFGNSTTVSKLIGQLGKTIEFDDSTVIYDATMGTIYGGGFRYVRLAAAATAVVVGQIVFWDISVADSLYQVTTSEAGSVPGACLRAGIVLNSGWTPGNYSYIQEFGPTYVQFIAALSQAPAGVGAPVYCAAIGAGVDNGFADVVNSANPVTVSDTGLLQNRYLGSAIDLPINGGLTRVNVNKLNLRG